MHFPKSLHKDSPTIPDLISAFELYWLLQKNLDIEEGTLPEAIRIMISLSVVQIEVENGMTVAPIKCCMHVQA